MRKNWRFLRLFFFLLLLGCQAAASTPIPTEVTASPSSDNQFIIWGLSGMGDELNNNLIQRFQALHPEMDVVILDQGWDEALRQNLENSILLGRPPDVVIGENYFRYFASRGEMLPLDDLIETYADDLIPATYAAAVYEGHVYAVPYFTGIFALERNCSVIESANLDCETAPEYWDDLLDEVRDISEEGRGRYYGYTLQGPGGTAVGSAFRIAVYQAQLDALPCADAACTIPDFNQERVIPVYEFLRELANYTPPGLLTNSNEAQVYEVLFRGGSAYQMAGSWHTAWATSTGCDTCRYSPIPRPREGHTANLVVGNVLFGIPSSAPHPEMAKEWLDLMLSMETQEQIFQNTGRIPIRRSVLEALQPSVDEDTGVFITELLTNESITILPQWEKSPREVWAIYNIMLEGILMGNQRIPELMAEAQAQIEALD
jgi:ABC-type glycerol-3-phosphate transport system substrate-binding protein